MNNEEAREVAIIDIILIYLNTDVKSSEVTSIRTTSEVLTVATAHYYFVVIRNIVYTTSSTDILCAKHL